MIDFKKYMEKRLDEVRIPPDKKVVAADRPKNEIKFNPKTGYNNHLEAAAKEGIYGVINKFIEINTQELNRLKITYTDVSLKANHLIANSGNYTAEQPFKDLKPLTPPEPYEPVNRSKLDQLSQDFDTHVQNARNIIGGK